MTARAGRLSAHGVAMGMVVEVSAVTALAVGSVCLARSAADGDAGHHVMTGGTAAGMDFTACHIRRRRGAVAVQAQGHRRHVVDVVRVVVTAMTGLASPTANRHGRCLAIRRPQGAATFMTGRAGVMHFVVRRRHRYAVGGPGDARRRVAGTQVTCR